MKAAYVEFRIESSTQNVREFYASRAGTHKFFTREAVACAITYSEVLERNKNEEFQPLDFSFENTPAEPVNVKTVEVVYKAGDDPNVGLLRYGRQEMILPGSTFHFVMWGDIPSLTSGQVFLIGKKRAAAQVTRVIPADVEPDTTSEGRVMPIQLLPVEVAKLHAFSPLIFTNRYCIVKVAPVEKMKRLKISDFIVPLID
jgi:hypothetical protein